MDYTKLFYWMVVADNARTVFGTVATVTGIIALISFIVSLVRADDQPDTSSAARKWFFWSAPICILFTLCFVLTPSKRDALLIVAGGATVNYLTTDSLAREIPHDVMQFVSTELKAMANEAKVSIDILNEKQRILDQAEQMSAKELISRMSTDSTFAKMILNK